MWSLPSSRGSGEHARTENVEPDAPVWCNFQHSISEQQVGSPVATVAARPRAAGSRLTQEHLHADCRRSGEPVEPDGSADQHNSQCAGGPSVGGERDSPAGPRNTAACDDANRVPRQSSAHSDDAARAPARTTEAMVRRPICMEAALGFACAGGGEQEQGQRQGQQPVARRWRGGGRGREGGDGEGCCRGGSNASEGDG